MMLMETSIGLSLYNGSEMRIQKSESDSDLVTSHSATPWTVTCQAPLSSTISRSLLKFRSIEVVMLSNHLTLHHPLLFFAFSLSQHQGFFHFHIRWPKYWSFSISPSNKYSGLISFRIDWFDLLAVQGTLKSLHAHNLKASIHWYSGFFMVQLSHPYLPTGKTIVLTI